jgi:RNA ligase
MWHKFKNVGEGEDYAESTFDLSQPHVIEEKLDGSCIAFFKLPSGEIRAGTRAGITDVSVLAENFLHSEMDKEKSLKYVRSIENCIGMGYTPIFEFCSRVNRVVIDYPVTKLVWTGLRNMRNGNYEPLHVLGTLGTEHKPMDFVKVVSTEFASMKELVELIQNSTSDEEGVVIKFATGRMAKQKISAYVLKHRTLDGLRFEKDVLKMVLTGILDDVLPLVADDIKARLVAYNESVLHRVQMAQDEMQNCFDNLKHIKIKKDFAEMVKLSPYRAGLFKMYDGKEYYLKDYILTKCGSGTDVESVRWIVGKSYDKF